MTAEYLQSPALPARHGFFTRRGGTSEGPYASLNCSLSGGDDFVRVTQNRTLAANFLQVAPERLVGVTQVHGSDIVVVDEPWPTGSGPRADAMITFVPEIALGIITADCAPVLFWEPAYGMVAAAHAGWRGAAAGILESVVTMMELLGADRTRIAAAVGPCIGQASYEVGDDLRDAVLPTFDDAGRFFIAGTRPMHWQFDLAGYCVARLTRTGVQATALGVDTCADEARFFSHRRRTLAGGGPIGHQLSAIAIQDRP